MLRKKLLISVFIILTYLILCCVIYKISILKTNITIDNKILISQKDKVEIIGKLYIPKINIEKNIYDINSKNNNIENNVAILKGSTMPNNDDSILFFAAHSGSGSNAYFDNLKYLRKNDLVFFSYKNTVYTYSIQKIEEIDKKGYIYGTRLSKKEIVLTTCSDNKNKQLLIHGILKQN